MNLKRCVNGHQRAHAGIALLSALGMGYVMLWKHASFAGSSVRYRHTDKAANAARRRTMQWIAFDSHKRYTWALVQGRART